MASGLLQKALVRRAPMGSVGSSLVEVLVAVLTFVVIVVGMGNSVISARRAGDSSRHLAEATTLAVDKLEHLRTLLLVDPEVLAGSHTDPSNPLTAEGDSGGTYTRTWTVTQDVPVVGMRQVRLTVSWNDRGRPGSVTLVAYLSLA